MPPAHLTVAFPLPSVAARLEAVIDFGEDEGIAEDVAAGVLPLVCDLRQQLEGHLASAASGELVRCGDDLLPPADVDQGPFLPYNYVSFLRGCESMDMRIVAAGPGCVLPLWAHQMPARAASSICWRARKRRLSRLHQAPREMWSRCSWSLGASR